MTDLVERLRAMSRGEHDDHTIGDEAADALEAAREDAARLDWLWRDSGVEGFVNVDADVYAFAQDVADDNNRDEPSREDYNAGFRRLIDAAMETTGGEP